jgi:hypothetical protein
MLSYGLKVKAKHTSLLQFRLIDQHAAASSSQTAPPPPSYDAAFSQIMEALGSLQREISTIGERVEQCQINIKECLKYHQPHNDDDD